MALLANVGSVRLNVFNQKVEDFIHLRFEPPDRAGKSAGLRLWTCLESGVANGLLKSGSQILGMESEWSGLALVANFATGCNQVKPVGPSGVGSLTVVVEAVDHRGELNA